MGKKCQNPKKKKGKAGGEARSGTKNFNNVINNLLSGGAGEDEEEEDERNLEMEVETQSHLLQRVCLDADCCRTV